MSIEAPNSREAKQATEVELFDPTTQTWEELRDSIMELEDLCFGDKGFEESYLKDIFENTNAITVLLRKEGKLVGFTSGIPDDDVEGALYVETTEINPKEQGKAYVVSLIGMLEDEARKRGYKYLTRNAATENGYADKIQKNYEGRIVETYENESEYGPQRYFKISL